jgi:SM-20-related protein
MMVSSFCFNDENVFDRIADALADTGWMVLDNVLDNDLLTALQQQAVSSAENNFRPAGVGRDQQLQRNTQIRSDEICWIEPSQITGKHFLDCMEQFRVELNRRLFLGLFDYESHYAHYVPGAFYKKHVDAFRGRSNRKVTTVLYLNSHWNSDDGGELVMYTPDDTHELQRVQPMFGRLVIFLSDRFPHEVLPAKKDRYSIAGWFRINATTGNFVDPA